MSMRQLVQLINRVLIIIMVTSFMAFEYSKRSEKYECCLLSGNEKSLFYIIEEQTNAELLNLWLLILCFCSALLVLLFIRISFCALSRSLRLSQEVPSGAES